MQTLKEKLLKNGIIQKGQIVGGILIPKMEVYGFVGYNAYLKVRTKERLGDMLDISLFESRIVVDRVVLRYFGDNYHTYPIFSEAYITETEKELELEYTFVHNLSSSKDYIDYIRKSYKHVNLQKIKSLSPNIFLGENNILHYRVPVGEIIMQNSNIYGVADSFLVLCRYINSVTGNISYAFFEPEDLFPLVE